MPLESHEIVGRVQRPHIEAEPGSQGGDHTAAVRPTTATATDLRLLGLDKASEDNTGHMSDGCVVRMTPNRGDSQKKVHMGDPKKPD